MKVTSVDKYFGGKTEIWPLFSTICVVSRSLAQQWEHARQQNGKTQCRVSIYHFKVNFTVVRWFSPDGRRLKTLSVPVFWISEIMSCIYHYHIESIIVYRFLGSMKVTAWKESVFQFIFLPLYVLKFPVPLLSLLENNNKEACQNLRSAAENLWILVWFCLSCCAVKGMI